MTSPRRGRMIGIAVRLSFLLACAGTPAAALPTSQPQHITVTLDRAKLIKLPEHVETIVVGSPIIADVTMLKKNNLVVITQGSWNTVIVNSNQVNNGNVTATSTGTVINGEIDLND